MPDDSASKNRPGRARKMLSIGIVALFCTLFVLVLALKIYLSTPFAAAQLSRLLSSRLHQPVRVTGLHTAGGALYLTGLSIGNPSGFPAGDLASAGSIVIAPHWMELLTGKRSFRLIALEGVRVDLLKNDRGVWNFSQLQQLLTAGKPSAAETFIGELAVKADALQVNGRGVNGVVLRVFNIATKGSADSRIAIDFEDSGRNRYRIAGKARSGNDPTFDLLLTAPSLSLKSLSGMLIPKNPQLLEDGRGDLRVSAGLRDGRLQIKGDLDFSRVALSSLAAGMRPLAGNLACTVAYDLRRDEARLEALSLTVENLLKAHASGTGGSLRHERWFSVEMGIDRLDLGALANLLTADERRRVAVGGTLASRAINISGNSTQGVTCATGSLMLRNGSLAKEGRLLFSGLDGTLDLSGDMAGLVANGRLSLAEPGDKALLQALDAPFDVALNSRLKPLRAKISAFSARFMGIPVTGSLGFSAEAASPITASLRIPATQIASLNPLLEKWDLRFASGTASLSVDAAGQGARDFSAVVTARLAANRMSRGKNTYALKDGSVDARIGMRGGQVSASGQAQLTGMAMDGRTGDARFSYRLADGVVSLSNAGASLDGTTATVASITARIPAKASGAGTTRYPLSLAIHGCDIRRGPAAVKALSGTMRGVFASDASGSWLEGAADIDSGTIAWQDRPLASPSARLAFSRSGGKGELGGTLLGGNLAGSLSFNPFALKEGGTFQLGIQGARLAMATDFIPPRGGITLKDGLLDVSGSGGYTSRDGLACRITAKGSDIAIEGSGNRTILAKGGIGLTGAISGAKVSVSDASLTAGDQVVLKLRGEAVNMLSQERDASLTFVLPETSVSSIIDTFVNILPRPVQEATLGGSIAAEGRFDLHGRKKLLNGSLLFKEIGLEVPAQKFTAVGIDGRLPFSLDFSGGAATGTGDALSFSRDNYPRLLEQFHSGQKGVPDVTVRRLAFGPMDIGPIAMRFTAGNGITEVTSLSSPIYQGTLFGKGYVTARQGIRYRGDLLLNDLSLIQLCNVFPKIRGYISGRVDGIASLTGEGTGKATMVGFSELWTREGSGEKMHVSKEFLQRLAGKKLRGFFFRDDRPYDRAEIKGTLKGGFLTFEALDISHTNLLGIRDLSVSVAPTSNRITLDRLFGAIRQAEAGGKAATSDKAPAEAPVETQFKWLE